MNSNCNFHFFNFFIKQSFHSQRLNKHLFEFSFGKGKVLRTKKTNYEKESKNNMKGVSLKLPISKNLSVNTMRHMMQTFVVKNQFACLHRD